MINWNIATGIECPKKRNARMMQEVHKCYVTEWVSDTMSVNESLPDRMRVVLLGQSGVGKTAILDQFLYNNFKVGIIRGWWYLT